MNTSEDQRDWKTYADMVFVGGREIKVARVPRASSQQSNLFPRRQRERSNKVHRLR
jgi:hypothetical protein